MNRWRCLIGLVVLATAGCGGGKSTPEALFTLKAGDKWVYQFAGTVTKTGTGAQTAKSASSTVTIQVNSTTETDANGAAVMALDRIYDIELLDGSKVSAIQRLYVTQDSSGIYVHGMNNTLTPPVATADSKFIPSTASPAYKFLYLPSPLIDGLTVTYTNPFALTTAKAYDLAVSSAGWTMVSVPYGKVRAKVFAIDEEFSGFTLTSAAISPSVGILGGSLTATVSTTTIEGTIALKSR